MHTIQINDDTYQVPSSWDGLTRKQLEYLARISQGNQPVEQLKILMLLYCLGARMKRPPKLRGVKPDKVVGIQSNRYAVRIRRKVYRLMVDEVITMSNLFDWLLRFVKGKYQNTYCICPGLTVNPYPRLRIRLCRFTGPDDCLFDITFEQFMYLQTYLDAAAADPQKLEYALACLWHTGRTFDIDRLERDARRLRRLSATRKMVMYWFILGSMECWAASYPRVFGGSGGGKVVGNVFDGQLRLLDSLAQHDMTKKDSVRKGLFVDALYSMDEQLRIQEEMKEKMQPKV